MKKLISIVSMFAMAAALSMGCKKNEDAAKPAETKPAETAPAVAPTPAPEAAKPAEPAAVAPAGATGVAECDSYVATLEKYSKCDKIDAAAKDATLKGAEAIKASFAKLDTPEAKKSAADGCKSAEDGIKAAWTAAGCQ